MKNAGFFAMLKIASIVFCALLSIPILKQKLKWFHWTGILIMCAGIVIKSIPAILNTFDTQVCIIFANEGYNMYDILLKEPWISKPNKEFNIGKCGWKCQRWIVWHNVWTYHWSCICHNFTGNILKKITAAWNINNDSLQFFRGLKSVFEEKYVKKYKIQPLRYVGFVGMYYEKYYIL